MNLKMLFGLLVLFSALMLLPLAASENATEMKSYAAWYDVEGGKATTDLEIKFNKNISSFEWKIPKDSENIEVSPNSEVHEFKTYKKLEVFGEKFDSVKIKYLTGSVIEESSDNYFIADLSGIPSENISVTLKLPERATLKYSLDSVQSTVMPKTGNISTDGKRIIINWDESNFQNGDSMLVIYDTPAEFNLLLVIPIIGILFFVPIFFFYLRKSGKHHAKQEAKTGEKEKTLDDKSLITRNLFEDEKKLVEILLDFSEEGLWQKQLQIKSGMSKVKISRKMRSLEQKGVIEKIPYGNTNKIRLKI